ncbi:hypothetical protein [Thalassobacillus hwangdonensis]|uniref:YrzI family protein n=1 Tax=Thalassobacillus hwangdonensis TaxID=546108 RepID=A0ABW3KYT4_9BACI
MKLNILFLQISIRKQNQQELQQEAIRQKQIEKQMENMRTKHMIRY